MTGLMIELQDWTPEQRAAIARVEMLRMQRAIRYYPSTLAEPCTVSTSLPATEPSPPHPLEAIDSAADMIGVTANAACSIALRNAILKGVPEAFWANMYDAAGSMWTAGWLP